MTDRFNFLTVALESDIRSDDAEPLINAIRQLRGVLHVTPHVVRASDYVAEERVRQEMGEKILKIIHPK
jgi:hypothetical protein